MYELIDVDGNGIEIFETEEMAHEFACNAGYVYYTVVFRKGYFNK